jgi:hypothetical protein
MSTRVRITAVLAAALALSFVAARPAGGQLPEPDAADVATIDGIVHAFYDVISGPAGMPRQWRRDSTLYMPGAMFVALGESNGKPTANPMSPEEFRRRTDASLVKNGFFEIELGRRVEQFGNVAQVRSVYEMRRAAGDPPFGRGVNYLLLYWDGDRWWISGAVWDDERPDNPLPAAWITRSDPAP